eukprot:scaffold271754_cov28-Tisochrysis_lutea.AAC.4
MTANQERQQQQSNEDGYEFLAEREVLTSNRLKARSSDGIRPKYSSSSRSGSRGVGGSAEAICGETAQGIEVGDLERTQPRKPAGRYSVA